MLAPNIIKWSKKSQPPSKPPEKEDPTEALKQQLVHKPQEAKQPVAQSVEKVPEYLGNSNIMEIHYLKNIKQACQIDRISEENKGFFDNNEEAKKAIASVG